MLFGEFLDGIMEAGAFLHFGIIVLAPDVPGKDGRKGGIGDGFARCGFFAVIDPTDEGTHIDGVRAANLLHDERGGFKRGFLRGEKGGFRTPKKGVFRGSKRGFFNPRQILAV